VAPARILVVEDEAGIADFLRRGLEGEGHEVSCAADGVEGAAAARTGGFDLVLLDLMLPGRDGLDVLAEIRRERPALPVIVLTARDAVPDRVEGLDAGAVDYVTKPFAFDELAARVRSHLRQAEQGRPTRIDAGDIEIDLLRRRVRRAEREVALSATEFDLLALLARHAGQVLPRDRILAAVWGYEHEARTSVLGVYISYLRRKLALPGRPDPIETVRSVGYRLRPVAGE
jgi:two-component system, OmpR family, response regulator